MIHPVLFAFFYCLNSQAVSTQDSTASNGCMVDEYKTGKVWAGRGPVRFEVPCRYLPGGTENPNEETSP
jgi:hypothetical protein